MHKFLKNFIVLFCFCFDLFGFAGYEIFPHFLGNQPDDIENQAVVNYNYQIIRKTHIAGQDDNLFLMVHRLAGDWWHIHIAAQMPDLTLWQCIDIVDSRAPHITVSRDLLTRIANIVGIVQEHQDLIGIWNNELNRPVTIPAPAAGNVQNFIQRAK